MELQSKELKAPEILKKEISNFRLDYGIRPPNGKCLADRYLSEYS